MRVSVGARWGLLTNLLAYFYHDAPDKELMGKGHHFLGYADDFNIYVSNTRICGERVMSLLIWYLVERIS